MYLNNRGHLFSYCIVLLILPQAVLAGKPKFPAPPNASIEQVASNLNVNGIKSDIRAFQSNDSIEKVVRFYRKEWKRPVGKDMPGFVETIDAAPWYIISRVEDDYLMTVQVQVQANNKSASWGYLSLSPLPDPNAEPPNLGKSAPKIPGSIVMNEMQHDDPGKKAITTILSNTHSVKNNADYYRNYYIGKGWNVETDQKLGHDEGHSLVFKTRRNRVTIMVLKDKANTRVVMNSVKNSLF